MKEIKFRAWIQNGEWNENQAYEMCYDLVFEEYEPINNLLAGIKHLMQYTGLKDKNGKEIYEGDILLIQDEWTEPVVDGRGPIESTNHLAPVDFKNGRFGVFINAPADIYARKGFWAFPEIEWDIGDTTREMEIIGNIYENPELL